MSRKYRPCPEKFALAHDFDTQRCTDSLKLCWKQGAGLNMSYEQYLNLKQQVLEICHDSYLTLHFKRDIGETDILIDSEDLGTLTPLC